MNKQEATKLLALIKIAYPTAYKDMDDVSKKATVSMWQMSFTDVPYPIMEQAFNHFRMASKFPPTVAEMVEELRSIHFQAVEGELMQKLLGNEDMSQRYRAIVQCTKKYIDDRNLGGLDIRGLPILVNGGVSCAEIPESL